MDEQSPRPLGPLRRITLEDLADLPNPLLSAPISAEAEPSCATCKGAGWLAGERGTLHPCACLTATRAAAAEHRRQDELATLAATMRQAMGPKLSASELDLWDATWPLALEAPPVVWEGYRYSAADQAATLAAAHALARTYAAAPSGWLYLVGPVGAGKSSLMAALLNALAETHELIGLYGVAADLLDYIRAGYARDADVRAEQRAAQLREAPLLCLDDLGAEQTTDWSEAALFGILNARWQHNRPTIITSNVPLSALSPRIQSRIAGMSAGPRPEIPVIAADARAYLRARGNR